MHNTFVDFDDENIEANKKIQYDEMTENFYNTMRQRKLDIITHENIEEEYVFKFYDTWDPYTGERLDKDPNGPLYFKPDELIRHFYVKRLKNLWVDGKHDDSENDYEGYYDDGVGAGKNMYVVGRGHHPELYLMRLPVIDCYVPKDSDMSLITMGPLLTDNEIKEIDKKAQYYKNEYLKKYNKKLPNLYQIKMLYDFACCDKITEDIKNICGEYNTVVSNKQSKLLQQYAQSNKLSEFNRLAVDMLKNM